MNNDNKSKSPREKKKFYTALYTCAGIMLAIAGAISVANFKSVDKDKENNQTKIEQKAEITGLEPVNNSKDESYKKKEETTTAPKKVENATEATTKATQDSKAQIEKATEKQTTVAKEEKVFSLFDDSKEMSWPVNGQIVMDYSVETAIFDKTLDQYRTNDSICISAEAGTDVKAAAEGVVENIFEDNENGKSVVINHGNGWMTTYSQLENNLMVEVGQVVGEGDVIGKVGEPTNYSVLLGSHLDFKITKNDQSTDPKLVLAQLDE